MYRRLSFMGVTNKRMIKLWKIKVFMWRAMQDTLQAGKI
jgi:hypothetical protein